MTNATIPQTVRFPDLFDKPLVAFPRDDVRVSAALERMAVAGQPAAIVRPRIDAQAFKGVGGQAVLAARVLFEGASAALPPYERQQYT